MYNRTEVLGDIHKKAHKLLDTTDKKEAYLNYRKIFKGAASFEKIQKFPIHLDIELDNVCNFACTFCPIG